VSLLYTGRPDPPDDVRVVSCVAKFADVSWVSPDDNNSPILEYVVYYTDSSAPDPEQLIVGSRLVARGQRSSPGTTVSAVIVTRPWVEYEFYVVAINALGESEKASQSNDDTPAVCQTPQTAPRRNPEDVCTRLGRANQLVIVWKVNSTDFCAD